MTPPHDTYAEQSVLGHLIYDQERISDVSLEPAQFYHTRHQVLFKTIKEMFATGTDIDLVTINDRCPKTPGVDYGYIASLMDDMHPNLPGQVKVIREKHLLRQIYNTAIWAQQQVDKGEGLNDLLMEYQTRIMTIDTNQDTNEGRFHLNDLLKKRMQFLEKLMEQTQEVTGISTGFEQLNKITGGLQGDDLIIVGGRPSMGKTSLALSMANAAAKNGVRVGVFSLEMSGGQLVDRLLAAESGVNLVRFKNGGISGDELDKIMSSVQNLYGRNIVIDETGGLHADEIFIRALQMKKAGGLDVLFIDHLNLTKNEGRSKHEEITNTVLMLKNIAKRLHIPVVCLAQLNRGVEDRNDKRPLLSDLRESGSIEEVADLVLLVYRDEKYYGEKSKFPGIVELNVAKQRNGPIGIVTVGWEKKTAAFY